LTKPDEYIRVVLGAKQNRVAAATEAALVVARAEEGRR
jgi:hypothetical protein